MHYQKKKNDSPRVFLDKALILDDSWCVGVDIVIVTSEIARLTPPSLLFKTFRTITPD